jgi:hypothetical protein
MNELPAYLVPPPSTLVVSGAANGTAAQAVTDLGVAVAATKVFEGVIAISIAASQATAVNAAGTLHVEVSWVPGTGGTAAQRVAAADIQFSANGATGAGQAMAVAVAVPNVTLYAGTTGGKFQYTVTTTGTISALMYDVMVNGIAQ